MPPLSGGFNFMKKLKVDTDLCIGCGLCAGTHGDIFAINADNKAEVIADADDDSAADAIANCPVQAITEE